MDNIKMMKKVVKHIKDHSDWSKKYNDYYCMDTDDCDKIVKVMTRIIERIENESEKKND